MTSWSNGAEFGPFYNAPVNVLVATIVHWVQATHSTQYDIHACNGCGRFMRTYLCQCKCVRYCHADCQHRDWCVHKLVCKQLRSE